MKIFKWLVYSLIIVFLFGCTLPTGGTPTGSEKNQGGKTPSIPVPSKTATPKRVPSKTAAPKPTKTASPMPKPVTPKGDNQPVNFDIPSQNDPAPSGILEQLSWAGMGGGDEQQECGNCNITIKNNRITLSNFQASQRLALLIYRSKGATKCADGTAEYVTTLSIQVDKKGSFSAGLSGPANDLYVVSVLDAKTGKKIWRSYKVVYDQFSYCSDSQSASSCPGAPPQRLKLNQMAHVCTSKDAVKLREGPGKNFSTIKSLVPGADLTVIGGPTCADNWSWWKVKTESGYTGWMAEGGDNVDTYFICPKP